MIEITLTKGYKAIVDDQDADLASFKWCVDQTPYARRKATNKNQHMHRAILERKIGRLLVKGEMCDHVNSNKLDNRRENLRVATQSQNLFNRPKNKNNTSGYKGVGFDKRANRWKAQIMCNGKNHNLGLFDTPEQAHEVYCKAAVELHKDFACVR